MILLNSERKPARLEEVSELNPELQRMYQESRARKKRNIFDILFRMWLIVMGFGITWIWLQILFG